MLYKISQIIGHIFFWLAFRVQCDGVENIPQKGGCLLVANHASFLDPFVMGTYMPRQVHFLMYARYFFSPLFHWYCKRTECIPLKKDGRDISALKQALRLLRSGEMIGIFPEGERSVTGKLGSGAPGVALIALKADVPILPVGIVGTYEAFPRGARFPRLRSPITVRYGKPFQINDEVQRNQAADTADEDRQQQITMLIMQKITDVCAFADSFA